MRYLARAGLVLAVLWLLPLRASSAQTVPAYRFMNAAERAQLSHAARLASHNRSAALRWLRSQSDVSWTGLAPDAVTIEVQYRDGAVGAVFHSLPSRAPSTRPIPVQSFAPRRSSHAPGAPRALVLEPFGIQLDLGTTSGQPEIDALVRAGFQVDVFRDDAVTIPIIESMATYSVVYMESHSGTCGPPLCSKTDVFVLTGTTVPEDVNPYRQMFLDGSLTEGVTDTSPGVLYMAFTSRLIDQHVGTFSDSSLVFINGCDLLELPDFLHALTAHGASSVYSWNKKVYNYDAEAAADFIFPQLASGETVSGALARARAAGLGTSLAENGTVLELLGDPDNSFAKSLTGATPTPTPTVSATPTYTPTPVPTATRAAVVTHPVAKCKKGYHRVKGKCTKIKKKR